MNRSIFFSFSCCGWTAIAACVLGVCFRGGFSEGDAFLHLSFASLMMEFQSLLLTRTSVLEPLFKLI